MKKSTLTIILLFCLATLLLAQPKSSIGINYNYALRAKENPDIYSKIGVGLGITGKIATGSPILMITAGGRYIYFPVGYEQTESGMVKHKVFDLVTPFFGIILGKEKGAYLVIAETGDFGEKETRFGLDAGVGYLYWEGPGTIKVDFSLKYCMANLMGTDEGEIARNYFCLAMGLAF